MGWTNDARRRPGEARRPAGGGPARARRGRVLRGVAGEGGFTLLEVLVAFAIAALALAVLFRVAVDAVGNAHNASRYTEALVRARSHLASLPMPPRVGDFQGDEGDGFHWHVRVTPDRHGTTRQNVPITLYGIQVSMSWTDGDRKRVVELDTKRVAVAAAE